MNIKKIENNYKNLPTPVKASLWYTVCNVINKGISLFSTPIFTRILTEEEYGTFLIFQSWCGILIIFTSLNIFLGGYQKGLLLYKDDINSFTSSQLGLTSIITISFLIIYLLNMKFWTQIFELSSILMFAMFIELLTMPALEFWSARQRFDYKYKKYMVITMLTSVLSIGIGIFAVLNTHHKVEARVFSDVFAKTLFAGIIYILIFIKGKTFFEMKYWKYALVFNLPLIPHYLSNYILNQSDRLMIGRMVGKPQAAYYGVAYTISTMMLLIITAINNSLTPYIYKSIDDGNIKNVKYVVRPLIVLVAGLCIVAIAFAPEAIYIFAGSRYMDAIYVIPPVAGSVYFIFLYSLFSNVTYFYQKTGFIATATSVSAAVNLILNYIFIKKYGYYAAGYTTLVCYICMALIHFIFYRRVLKQKQNSVDLYDIRLIVIISIASLIIIFLMVMIYEISFLRYLIVGIIIMIAILKRKCIVDTLLMFKK